jgi:drug/metabolite transporter (DMT)-like permease
LARLGVLQGEVAALTAAFLWALSTVLFGRLGKSLTPLVLNLVKGLIAIAFIGATLLLRGDLQPALPERAVLWLLLSGAIGIGLGDTAYFAALNALGARRVLLLESLAPPLAAVIALVFLQESLSLRAWTGIFLILLGVGWVISERVSGQVADQPFSWKGLGWGVLAALGQAVGAVMSRAALAETVVDPLWSGLLRIGAGAGVLLLLLSRHRLQWAQFQVVRSRHLLPLIVLTAFLGTYLAIWLQQVSFKYAPTGIAQALMATSPLFVLPMTALLGDRISGRAVGGVCITISGIWLLIH